jgi:hypothetical protein
VIAALNWLTPNYDLYKNIRLSGDRVESCQQESEDIWNSLFVDDEID